MSPCGPGSPSIPVSWAATLLLFLGVERALALPEVQEQVRAQTEAALLGQPCVALALPRLSPEGPQLRFHP